MVIDNESLEQHRLDHLLFVNAYFFFGSQFGFDNGTNTLVVLAPPQMACAIVRFRHVYIDI